MKELPHIKNCLSLIHSRLWLCNTHRDAWDDDEFLYQSKQIVKYFQWLEHQNVTFKRLEPIYDYYRQISENG